MNTTTNVSIAMKNGRQMSGLRRFDAAEELGIDERTLSRYETVNPRASVKQDNPALIASAIRLYDDPIIGMVYLSGHPVVIEMTKRFFGQIIGAVPDTAGATPDRSKCRQCNFNIHNISCQSLFDSGQE